MKTDQSDHLKTIEIAFLSLMVIALPSLEAPKNIFLVLYVITACIRWIKTKKYEWGYWDSIFSTFILTNIICTYFAGIPHHNEWQGFRVSLTILCTGWLIARANYTLKEIKRIYYLIILGTIPPLLFGLWNLLISKTKDQLELHSVGHVNHSAIYLLVIFGASLTWFLSGLKFKSNLIKFILFLGVALFFYGLIVGQSRGAFGVAFTLAILIVFFSKESLTTKITFYGALILLIPSLFLSQSTIAIKQLSYQNGNNIMADRTQIWNAAAETARTYPFFGIGMYNWSQIKMEDLRLSVEKRNEKFNPESYKLQFGHAHSLYFSTLAEKGLVGLSMLIFFMIMWLRELVKNYPEIKNNSYFLFWGGAASAWAGIFGVGLVNSTFNHENGILACVLLGLYLSSNKLINQKKL